MPDVPNVGNPGLPSSNNRSMQSLTHVVESEPSLKPEPLPEKPLDFAIPLQTPKLIGKVRSFLSSAEFIDKFIGLFKHKWDSSLKDRALRNIGNDTNFCVALEELDKKISRAGIDLLPILITKIKSSRTDRERTIYSDMIISLGRGEEEFSNEYLMPALEKRGGFTETEKYFCIKLLDNLQAIHSRPLIQSIDWTNIHNIDSFAHSLSRAPKRVFILKSLLENYHKLESEVYKSENAGQKQRKIQDIFLSAMKKLIEEKKTLPIKQLKELYKTTAEQKLGNEIAQLLRSQTNANAGKFFLEQFFNSIHYNNFNDDYKVKLKYFYAIIHYSETLKEKASQKLKEFILKCEDPFLIGIACNRLATHCGEEGKETLADTIYETITKGKESIPLAFVSSVATYGENYLNVLRRVFSMPYKENCSLKEAYINGANLEICKITPGKEGELAFNFENETKPELAVDLIRNIGLKTFSHWVFELNSKTETVNKTVLSNLKDVFQAAYEQTNPDNSKINNILLGGLTHVSNSDRVYSLILLMGGLEHYGMPAEKLSNLRFV